jgi:hypothetical protein
MAKMWKIAAEAKCEALWQNMLKESKKFHDKSLVTVIKGVMMAKSK